MRLGIAARLTIAFGAVAVLAVAANLLVEHGASMIRTIEIRSMPKPAPRTPSSEALTAAVHGFAQSALTRLDEDTQQHALEMEAARSELRRETTAYIDRARGLVETARLQRLGERSRSYEERADELVSIADERRRLLRQYWETFEALDRQLKTAVNRGFKVFGRVLARRSLLELSRHLDSMRAGLAAFAMREGYDAATLDEIIAAEAAFSSTLERNESSLTRAEGDAWVSALRRGYAQLISTRGALISSDGQRRQAIASLSEGTDALVALARPGEPTRATHDRAPGRPAGGASRSAKAAGAPPRITTTSTVEEDTGARAFIAWLSAAVLLLLLAISIFTVYSIVWPVRRLMAATRRLADGDTDVNVPRGGIRELDALAISFNQMAVRLADAQSVARRYQGELEDRVAERTRQLQHLAEHDPLTELPNRRQLFAQLDAALREAARDGHLVGVFFLDLDNFKNINDSMGHALGDRVLEGMAARLREELGAAGFAARLGGDEFTVVCSRSNAGEIQEAGRALVHAFQRPLVVDNLQFSLGVSVGASIYPDHGGNAEALLRAADAALFRAKALGRSQLNVFSPDLLELAASKFTTEQGLRRALERDEFELAFQPEINTDTGRADVVEALLRWRLPDGRQANPAEFLAVAEESGLIIEISDWVLRSAIAAAARWYRGAWPEVRIAINVSARQLLDGKFVRRIETLLRRHRLPADRVEIELTETVLQTGVGTVDALRRLRGLGIGIALDDFGTGYSSLASLEQLPLTRVKLDRSLIAAIDDSARSLAIAEAIIGLCHGLKLRVTAEGIERPEQLKLLRDQGPICLQGYLLARPMARDDVPSELARIPLRLRFRLGRRRGGAAPRRRRAG